MNSPIRLLIFLLFITGLTACDADSSAPSARPERVHLVEVGKAELGEHSYQVERIGSLRARREVKLLAQEEGRLVALPVFEGDRVDKGALLFRLDDALLRAELDKAAAQTRQAQVDVERLRRLQDQQLVSEDELVRARTALEVARANESLLRIRYGYTRVMAPFAGVISARLAEPEDVVGRLSHVLTLTDLDSLVTEVNVSELLLPGLRPKDPVDLRIDALGGAPFQARIERIHPNVDPVTRQGVVEVALEPAPPGARPGQLARLTLRGQAGRRLTVPFAALRRDSEGEFVFGVQEGQAVRVGVVSGLHLGQLVEILQGLSEGDAVITRGFLNLAPGTAVKVVNTSPERP